VARYRIVPEQSRLWIEGRSTMHPIHSTTDGLEGFVELAFDSNGEVDTTAPSSGKLSLSLERLSSGNRTEDRELFRRIDIRRYPKLEGALEGIESAGDGSYKVAGSITFRGTVRAHNDLMTIRMLDERSVELTGSSRFDVRDFGMEPPRLLMLRVEPEVEIRVEIRAEREG
jgi:polyisoprenoid-binding protein YceI